MNGRTDRTVSLHPVGRFSKLGEEIADVEAAGADGIHIDVMDGHFVPNLTIGPIVLQWIRKVSKLPYWAHLMMDAPLRFADAFREAGTDGLTVHPETCGNLLTAVNRLRGMGLGVGMALKPETSIGVLDPVLERLDRVLILTVPPGFGGQKLMPEVLGKNKKPSLQDRIPLRAPENRSRR